mmetsp:Transcript_103962/g.310478  ORF Transcript_103962/g.310478 Transcript_103962/m.310478 type:complete len:297 (-) Transcript_103962:6-896(-)
MARRAMWMARSAGGRLRLRRARRSRSIPRGVRSGRGTLQNLRLVCCRLATKCRGPEPLYARGSRLGLLPLPRAGPRPHGLLASQHFCRGPEAGDGHCPTGYHALGVATEDIKLALHCPAGFDPELDVTLRDESLHAGVGGLKHISARHGDPLPCAAEVLADGARTTFAEGLGLHTALPGRYVVRADCDADKTHGLWGILVWQTAAGARPSWPERHTRNGVPLPRGAAEADGPEEQAAGAQQLPSRAAGLGGPAGHAAQHAQRGPCMGQLPRQHSRNIVHGAEGVPAREACLSMQMA